MEISSNRFSSMHVYLLVCLKMIIYIYICVCVCVCVCCSTYETSVDQPNGGSSPCLIIWQEFNNKKLMRFLPNGIKLLYISILYFNNYVISIWFMNYYNSTQRRDYNNVILNYMIVVRSNERTMIWSLMLMINVISNLIFVVVRLL